jgi:type II secretory pathway pseudopilin PulG
MNRARTRTRTSSNRGLTLAEVLLALSAIIILLSLVMPALARGRGESAVARSLANLQTINAALESYANDFNGRQPTAVVDDFGTYGATGSAAVTNYFNANGTPHPPVLLGEDEDGAMWGFYMPPSGPSGNYVAAVPIGMGSLASSGQPFGFFRIFNAKIMQDYVGRRWFDPTFYAPNDVAAYSIVGAWLDVPDSPFGTLHEDASQSGTLLWSSYCFSPAAMFGPQVLASTANGGYTNPYGTADGFRSPHVTQAKHPAQKTRVMEHSWCQNTPENRCNPAFIDGTYAGCEPYYFNHGAASAPATLFFDGSTRLLPNSEVLASDAQLIKQTGEGVWHRGTPFGATGYRGEVSYDGTIVSHHILTIDGILGRDTLGP